MSNGISGLANAQRSEFPIARTDKRGAAAALEEATQKSGKPDFSDAIASAMDTASVDENVATEMATKFSEGDPDVGVHEVIIASERANISLRYTVAMKNKLIDAYREIMNTQV